MDMIHGAVPEGLVLAGPDETLDRLHHRLFELFDAHTALGEPQNPAVYWVEGPAPDPRVELVPISDRVYRKAPNLVSVLTSLTSHLRSSAPGAGPDLLPDGGDGFRGLIAVDTGWGLSPEAGAEEREALIRGRIRPRVSQRPDRIRLRIMVACTVDGRLVNGYEILHPSPDAGERRLHEPRPADVDAAYSASPFAQVVRECMQAVHSCYQETMRRKGPNP